ncbi:MAG: AI-2E family transporter [Pseudomonadota bacterium]|nr:AI-2E family transporter [Pseudomonadota bacterium]
MRSSARSSAGAAVVRSRRPPPPTAPGWGGRLRWAIAFVVIGGVLVYLTGSLLSVLVASAVIAYLIDPLVTRLQVRGYSREGAIVAIGGLGIAAVLVAVGVIVPGLVQKVSEVGADVSPYLSGVSGRVGPLLDQVEARFGVVVPTDLRALAAEIPSYLQKLSPDARKSIQEWLGRLAGGGLDVVLSVLTVTLLPVFTFYLLRDWPMIVGWVDELVPVQHRAVVRTLATEIDGRIASFVKGQLLVAAILAGLYTVGLLIAGVDLAVTMGLLSGALFLLPYIGPLIGAAVSIGLALIQFGFDWHVIVVAATYGVGQLLENTVLTPMLVGDRVGLHPMVVMVALIIAGNVLGLWGLVVALPVTAALAVVGAHVLDQYRASRTYLG